MVHRWVLCFVPPQSGLLSTRDLRLVAVQSKESPSMIAADPDRCLMDGDTCVP